MLKAKQTLKGSLNTKQELNSGKLNNSILKVYPELEDIEITPTTEEQKITSVKYGFENITVKKVTADIDEDIQAENIREGINILGVDGSYKGIDTSGATATENDILLGKTAFANNQEIIGTIEEYDGSYSGSASDSDSVLPKITDGSYLFYNGARLNEMNEVFEIAKELTNCNYMFSACSSVTDLDLSSFDSSNVIEMNGMFYNCKALTNLNISTLDTSNVTDMSNMFYYCQVLPSLDLKNFNTSNVTTFNRMFHYCRKLTDLDLSSFDMSNVIDVTNMFYWCSVLENLKSFKNLGKGYTEQTANYSNYALDLSDTKVKKEDIKDLINNLYDLNLTYDVANGGTLYTQTLELSTIQKSRLTSDDKAIIAAKGWNLA